MESIERSTVSRDDSLRSRIHSVHAARDHVILLEELADRLGSNQDKSLSQKHEREEDMQGNVDHEELDEHLDDAHPASVIKGFPGVLETDSARPPKDTGNDTTGKGSVEWDDGIVFVRQHGGLDARKGDRGGDGETNKSDEENGKAGENLGCCDGSVSSIGAGEEHKAETWKEEGKASGDISDDGWDHNVLPRLSLGDARPPCLLRGFGDDDMAPSHGQASSDGSGDHGTEHLGSGKFFENADVPGREGHDALSGALEDESADPVGDQAVGGGVDNEGGETSPAGTKSSARGQVLHGGADVGGDGLVLDEDDLGVDGVFGVGVVGFVACLLFADKICILGLLDHGKVGYDAPECVSDLVGASASILPVRWI